MDKNLAQSYELPLQSRNSQKANSNSAKTLNEIEDVTIPLSQKDGYDDLLKISVNCFEQAQSIRLQANARGQANASSNQRHTQTTLYALRRRIFAEARKAGYGEKDRDADAIVRLILLKDGSLTKEIEGHLKADIYRRHFVAVKHLLSKVVGQENSSHDTEKRQEYSRLLHEHKAQLDEYREAYSQYTTEARQRNLERKYYPLIEEGFKCGLEPEQVIAILFLKYQDSIQYSSAAAAVFFFSQT